MHLLDRVSKAFEKSRATSAPDFFLFFFFFFFFLLRYFAKSSNNLKCEAIFLPLTNLFALRLLQFLLLSVVFLCFSLRFQSI